MKQKRKPITPKEMEAAYRLCLERERDRERKRKLTKQGAFESKILHFDLEAEEALEREKSVSWLSDHGCGARQMYRTLDPRPPKPTREQLIDKAKHRVARHAKDCLPVFWLIIKNGNNRKESIWELTKLMRLQRPSTGTN